WHPGLRAEKVTFANAEWGEKRPMFSADAIALRISLRDLLRGRYVISQLELENGDALLERDARGQRNWILKPPGETDKGQSPEIQQLAIRDSRIRVKDAGSRTDVEA